VKIVLRPHLKIRLAQRNIPLNYPNRVIKESNEQYFDTLTKHQVAVHQLEYNGKIRPMAAAYDIMVSVASISTSF